MKERKGPFGMMVGGIVDSVVQTARRRAQDREPRVLVYDASGRPRLLGDDDSSRLELIASAAVLIELAAPRTREAVDAEAEAAADGEAVDGEVVEAEALDPEAVDAESLDAEVVDVEAVDAGDAGAAAAAEAQAEAETQADAGAAGADEDPGETRV